MTDCHKTAPKPSPLVALVCLAVVARLHPDWIAVTLGDAASQSGIRGQRLSRLCSRAIAPIDAAVLALSRIGRPPTAADAAQPSADRDLMAAALLDVATSLLSASKPRGAWVRSLVVGAWLRLKADHPKLTQKRFAKTLAISERTFRHWLNSQTPPPTSSVSKPAATANAAKSAKRPPRRGRFSFAVTLPDTQIAADTTDLKAFGQPLKLIAAQDIGGRDQDLLDAVIVDDHESAELVAQVLTEALQDHTGKSVPGQQVVTDQGTPYMAQLTSDVLEQLGADHAPQREADPLGKATIERAFGTIKSIAQPLLSLTNRIADAIQTLRNIALAKALTTVLLTALLRAYQAGARAARTASEQRAGLDEQTLSRAAENSRQRAHADDRSARLLLSRLHAVYAIGGPLTAFIRAFRHVPLEVLRRAERAFASQAHRDDIRDRKSYFAAIVRRIDDVYQAEQATQRRHRHNIRELDHQIQRHNAQLQHWAENPPDQIQSALTALAQQWDPKNERLLFGGAGLGRAWLTDALNTLVDTHGTVAATDLAVGSFDQFARQQANRLGPARLRAINQTLQHHLGKLPTPGPTAERAKHFPPAILRNTGPPTRSDPSLPLRT